MTTMTYIIHGMHCKSCLDKIKQRLQTIATVSAITFTPPRVTLILEQPLSVEFLNAELSKEGEYHLSLQRDDTMQTKSESTGTGIGAYYPILLIVGFITMVTLINNISTQRFNAMGWMNQFMAGFFLVFSAFKFLDIKGFAEGYATYDLLAKRWFGYGFIYPFLECGLGLLYLLQWTPILTNVLTVILMSFSALGVLLALAKKQTIRCACLGTVINVPLSNITLIEDSLMALLAAISLFA